MLCVATLAVGIVRITKWQQELSSMNYDVSECANATSFALGLAWFCSLLIVKTIVLLATNGRSLPQEEKYPPKPQNSKNERNQEFGPFQSDNPAQRISAAA